MVKNEVKQKVLPNKHNYRLRLLKLAEKAKKAGYSVDIQEDLNCIFVFLFRDKQLCVSIYLPYDRFTPCAEKEISQFEKFVETRVKI